MKKNFKIINIIICSLVVVTTQAYAARVYLKADSVASPDGRPVAVTVYLDGEGDVISSLSGSFSYPAELFDLDNVSTKDGVISTWITSPQLSNEKSFDGRTHITFAGVIPGGFGGVRSPAYAGVRPGTLFTVKLIPKAEGRGNLLLSELEMHAYDAKGTTLKSENSESLITVPNLIKKIDKKVEDPIFIKSETLKAEISRNKFVYNNAWYVSVFEDEVFHSIDHIELSESSEYNPFNVSKNEWHTVTSPSILLHQSRNKYVHVKVFYTDNTYSIKTLSPVENSKTYTFLSRIIISIILAIFLLDIYAKKRSDLFSKETNKHH